MIDLTFLLKLTKNEFAISLKSSLFDESGLIFVGYKQNGGVKLISLFK
jgi:hypothetical protein